MTQYIAANRHRQAVFADYRAPKGRHLTVATSLDVYSPTADHLPAVICSQSGCCAGVVIVFGGVPIDSPGEVGLQCQYC